MACSDELNKLPSPKEVKNNISVLLKSTNTKCMFAKLLRSLTKVLHFPKKSPFGTFKSVSSQNFVEEKMSVLL